MLGFIYKYENKLNHKVYIGQTTDLVNRKSAHKYKAGFVKSKFYNAVRKYGWESFDFDILAQVEEDSYERITEVLDSLEAQFIEEYDSFHNGYNSTGGGRSYRGKEVSEEFREFCRNRQYSEETRRKISEGNKGKTYSEEAKEKFRYHAIRRKFWICSPEKAAKRRKAIKDALAKRVLQLDKEGNVVNEFETEIDAAKFIQTYLAPDKKLSGIAHGVFRHCDKITKTRYYYGFEWKFKTNV